MKSTFVAMAAVAGAVELTPANYDEMTAGKTAFIKFFAPWCGHCKKMKPDWDNLMTEFADSSTVIVADVDCTAAGKPLCDAQGVKGFPTLKTGEPSALEDYKGGRDLAALKAHVATLKPSCSPSNIDLCDAEEKAKIEKVQAMDDAALDAAIQESSDKLTAADKLFEDEVAKLQATYKQLQEDKEAAHEQVKASGLSLLKAVKAAKGKAGKIEL